MLKSAILIILISVVALFFQTELAHALRYLMMFHDEIVSGLNTIFSSAPTGQLIQQTVALIVIPVVVGAIVALVFYLVKRKEMPHVISTVWIVWTVLIVATILSRS